MKLSKIRVDERDNLPHSDDSERALLGACLIDPDAIYRVQEQDLQASDFLSDANAAVYRTIDAIAHEGGMPNLVTVGARLGQSGELQMVGGPSALTEMIELATSTVLAGEYAKTVRTLAHQRRIISMAGDVAAMAHGHTGTLDELLQQVTGRFFEIVQTDGHGAHLYGTEDALLDYLANQQTRQERDKMDPNSFITTGIPSLDRMLGDMPDGYFQIVAARTSVGKTMYMEQLAEHNARRGRPVAYYHLELGHQGMLDRRMARASGIQVNELRRGYSGKEIIDATQCIEQWQKNVTYIHCPGWSADRIVADMTRLCARGLCELALVDYLQKVALPTSKTANGAQLVGMVCEAFKNAAERLEIVVVMGSQVRRDKGRPTMEHLRDSGEIAEKANQVVMLHRTDPDVVGPTEMLEAYVDKNTMGETGMTELVHMRGRYTIADMAEDPQ